MKGAVTGFTLVRNEDGSVTITINAEPVGYTLTINEHDWRDLAERVNALFALARPA